MLNDEHNTPDTIPVVGFDHEDPASRVQLSANTRARLEKLARWRIDPALLKFPKSGPNFEGGYAIVSRAFLASVAEPSGGELRSNDRVARAENDKRDQGPEGGNQEANQKEDGTEEEDQEFERSGRWKAVAVKKMKMKEQDDVVRVLGLTLREAEFLVKLSHENIIKLEGLVEDVSNNQVWLVFPWEASGNLKDFIASADWEIPERVWLIDDVARGVEYLHGREPPICHGDLKSINILVNSECRAVITDFGSARHPVSKSPGNDSKRTNKEPQPAPSLEATHCPSTNTITLTCNHYTLRWAAPELLEDEDPTLASDIWALGWVAYEVMTNTIPFQDVKDSMVVKRIVRGDLPSISSDARMLLIQALCSLMRQCWDVEPRKRPSAKDFRDSIGWIPMIAPSPIRTEGTADLVNGSPELLKRLGRIYRRHADYPRASKYFSEALAIYTDSGNNQGKAWTLRELAHIKKSQAEYGQAFKLLFECLQIYTDIGSRQGRGDALWDLGDVHRLRQEYPQATTCYSECLQIRTNFSDRQGRAIALLGLAEVHRARNEDIQAIDLYSECLQIWTDIGHRRGRADVLWGLAEVHRSRKEYSQAAAFYSECLQIRTDIGDRRGRASALRGLAEVHRLQKKYSQAMPLFSEALTIFTEIGDRYGTAIALHYRGHAHRDQHDYSTAIHTYEQAAEIYKQIEHSNEAIVLEDAAEVRRLMEQGTA